MHLLAFKISWIAVFGSIALYLLNGLYLDMRKSRYEKASAEILPDLSVLLFDSNDEAAVAFERLVKADKDVLLQTAQTLSLDINGEARERLQQLARSTGLERNIRRSSTSRRWRNRVQAAQLHYLVTHPDYDRTPLLTDKHPLVRARAAETLTADQAVTYVEEVANLLGDSSLAVRMGAQGAMLRAGVSAVEPLLEMLKREDTNVASAMQVAANLPDPRLVEALSAYANSPDPQLREMTALALGSGTGLGAIEILRDRLMDADERVRAAAISGLQRLESRESVAAIGKLLRDQAWSVRRAAGYALDELGAPGQLILRRALHDDDPYARDMARQVLDGSMALSARAESRMAVAS